MKNDEIAKELLAGASQYHEDLINIARGVDRFRQIMEFIVRCIDFAQSHLPEDSFSNWLTANSHISLMNKRGAILFSFESDDPATDLDHLVSGSTTGSSDAYLFLMDHYNFYETKEARDQFLDLSKEYRGLFARPVDINYVLVNLRAFDPEASDKFDHSLESMASLPEDEDPQGPLLEMRSAIDLALDTLLNLTPLSRAERGDLKSVQLIPAIAKHLARDGSALVDLLEANKSFEDLKRKLAASKQKKFMRDQAEALITQSIALLAQIVKSIELPDNDTE